MNWRGFLLLPGSPQHQQASVPVYTKQDLFPNDTDETLPDDEDDRLSLVALETELKKYLADY